MKFEPQVLAALLTGIVSLIVAIISFLSTRSNQRDIEKLKSELTEQRSERDARRDYEYEARKRLYQQYEPLFFQLTESAELALEHIHSLAEQAREGHLEEGGYLSKNSYYLKTSVYKLLVPIAIFKLIHSRLTLIDLQVDTKIHMQYFLAKLLYLSYTQDQVFARLGKKLAYDPYSEGWAEKRKANPQIYWRQCFPAGRLDNVIDSLIIQNPNDASSVVSFGHFEESFNKVADTDVSSALGVARDMFFLFHPQRRPVLWRILICHAHIYTAILQTRYETACDIGRLWEMFDGMFRDEKERSLYDWRRKDNDVENYLVLGEPFSVAREYLRKNLIKTFFSRDKSDA